MLKVKITIVVTIVALISSGCKCAREDDEVVLSNITVFPQDYDHKLRAGYLNITAYNLAFYYLLS